MQDNMENKEYYINIPQKVAEALISLGARMLYGQISRLSNKEGYCYASNKYLGELLHCNERSIQRFIEELKKNKFIKVKLCKSYIRHIYII